MDSKGDYYSRPHLISNTSPVYSYFKNEYTDYQRVKDKGIIVTSGEIKSKSSVRNFQVFLDGLRRKNSLIVVKKGTETYSYFDLEQKSVVSKDQNDNILVPEENVGRKVR